jgi:LDH2 family malate/lactate/ureidoglycolate dehydrogenase
MGTSAYMMTEVMLRERLGELLPEGVALGPEGEPTRDPTATDNDAANFCVPAMSALPPIDGVIGRSACR